jgi:hypothetical protein
MLDILKSFLGEEEDMEENDWAKPKRWAKKSKNKREQETIFVFFLQETNNPAPRCPPSWSWIKANAAEDVCVPF